jgi:hypothetical protein
MTGNRLQSYAFETSGVMLAYQAHRFVEDSASFRLAAVKLPEITFEYLIEGRVASLDTAGRARPAFAIDCSIFVRTRRFLACVERPPDSGRTTTVSICYGRRGDGRLSTTASST